MFFLKTFVHNLLAKMVCHIYSTPPSKFRNVFQITIISLVLFLQEMESLNVVPDRKCGSIFAGKNFEENYAFVIKDFDQSVNLKRDYRSAITGWRDSNSIRVESDCIMTICNERYFQGDCESLKEGKHQISQRKLTVNSAKCIWKRKCSCKDTHLSKHVFVRAYLHGNCNSCDTEYIDLVDNDGNFHKDYTEAIKSLILRKGCRMNGFSEKYFEGDSFVIDKELTEDFSAFSTLPMASYNVTCNDAEYMSQQEKPKSEIYKPAVTIPTKHDELLLMSSNKAYSKHPGVQAALKSFQSGKGSNFAYVLVFADAWSPIMETFWDCRYPWDKISDCRFHVPLDKLGISNAELRIITVIGLGNEPDENYRIIATLDDYISDNPQLKDASPTAIILTHDSQDEGISEKHNVFQCKLQALGELKAQIVNQKYSNVVFLLRMPAQWNVNFENLEKNIARFETAIHEHWSLPEPTHIILDWFCLEAVKVNGYCKLPSGEYFPRNLKERLKVICMKSSDPLGHAIFEAAFAYDSTDDVFEDKIYTEVDLLPANHSKVDEYGYLAENPLMAQLISRTKTREQELKKESLASLSGVLESVDDRMSKTEALIQELKAELEKKKSNK